MPKLTPYLIAEFKTGLSTYLQPFIRPNDAFEPLENAYTYRGVVNKRNGFTVFANQLSDQKPVMGIMNRIDESTSTTTLEVASTQNFYILAGTVFNIVTGVGGDSSIFWQGTATGTITVPTFWPNISPASVTITDGTDNLTFDAGGAMNSAPAGIFAAGSSINYTTGSVTINFTGTTTGVSLNIALTLTTGYFTGNNNNFFNWVSWQASGSLGANTPSYLYMTNNVDPVTLFDGTLLSRPILYVDSTNTNYITKALDVQVFQNRLLLIRPTRSDISVELNQTIYFSAQFNPLNFISDVEGNGGEVTAATGDAILSEEFIRNAMVVFFSNSVWLFRFTGSFSDPFRFDRISVTKTVNAPYGSIAYDERCTAVGSQGLVACDGANLQRYDVPIIDFYESEISEQYYAQVFGQRYDNLNQGWMFYVSNENDFGLPYMGAAAPGSDKALIYNFLENSWATYKFPIPMTCMGRYLAISGLTWAAATFEWESGTSTWNSYGNQKLAPILLAGDVNGNVYWMDNVEADVDASFPVTNEAIGTGDGTSVQFTGTLASPPIQIGSLVAGTNVETFLDNGNGTLTGSLGGNGSINYVTGAWVLNFNTAPANLAAITASYIHGYSILPNITSTRWNPVLNTGQKNQFAYIDIYYSAISVDPNDAIQLTLTFFVDNSNTPALVKTLTLDGPQGSEFAFKRIYVNLIGEFIQMNIDPNEDGAFQILGFILWINPAGRLTPGSTV